MCGRYSLVGDPFDLRSRFRADAWPETVKQYNIAPTDEIVVVGPEGARAVSWGLRGKVINARSETAQEKFGGLGRCLVPADGFFEWHGGRPFHITRDDQAPFAFAGLAGRDSAVILTCTPSELIAPLHDRMPVMLPADLEQAWLDGAAPIAELARPFAAVRTREVSRTVNDARHDGPDCLAEPEQPALF